MKINSLNRVSLFLLIVLMYPSAMLAEDIPLMKRGGVYTLPVAVNGVITLNFILDTGAAEVNIPADVALTLYRAGTIRDTDFLPGQTYTLADGSTLNSSRFLLRNLTIGSHRIANIPASVGEVSSPLLLGQSFLERLGTWGFDSQKQVLTIGTREKRAPREASTSLPLPENSPSSPPSRAISNTGNNHIPTASVAIPNTKLGDTYIIEYLYPDSLKSSYSIERKVVAVDDGKITVAAKNVKSKMGKARTLQFTAEGNLLSSRNPDGSGFDYSPPLKYFAFPLYPGKTWQQTSRETNIQTGTVREHMLSATVSDWEDISVPAGTFRAIRITLQTELLDPSTGETSRGTDISWYAPDIRRSVKSDITSQNSQGQQERQVIQLIRYDLKSQGNNTKDKSKEDGGISLHIAPKNLVPKISSKQVQLTFKEAIDTCSVIVRKETDDRLGFKHSQFDAFLKPNGTTVSMFGTAKERFSFEKCMNEKGHPLESRE